MAHNKVKSTASMADVSGKKVTHRLAIAAGRIFVGPQAMEKLQAGQVPKGDPLAMAEIAGILAAKQTPALLPLCHPISLNRVAIRSTLQPQEHAIDLYCVAEIAERTGVEMEALTGLNIALLTVWDLLKPINAALRVSDVRLLYKSGGKSGEWRYPGLTGEEAKAVEDLLDEFKS